MRLKQFICKDGRAKNPRERGSFLMESALVSWTLLFMLMGCFQMGVMLIRAIQAGEVCRNANVLQVRGVDLSQSQNQQILLRTGPYLGMNTAGSWTPSTTGSGVVYLSKVYMVGPLECSNGVSNFDGTISTCPNLGSYVIQMRITIGNTNKGSSVVGNPSDTPGTNGYLTDNQVCTNTANVAQHFPAIVSLAQDQYTWVAEIFADSTNFNLFNMMAAPTIYMRNIS
jgi:hypothetical protein